jgi:hypothetical protein
MDNYRIQHDKFAHHVAHDMIAPPSKKVDVIQGSGHSPGAG